MVFRVPAYHSRERPSIFSRNTIAKDLNLAIKTAIPFYMKATENKKSRRLQAILTTLESRPAARISDLAEMLEVSSETIRRDLQELEAEGEIHRTYGGAVRQVHAEPSLLERMKLNAAERSRIAKAAVSYLGDAGHIFIGGGSTAVHFSRALSQNMDRQIIAITISFSVAEELGRNPNIQVVMLPGIFDPKERIVHGPETLAGIERFRASITIISASAADYVGLSEGILNYAHSHAAMIENADKTLILMESQKFGRRALSQISSWSERNHLLTDRAPTDEIQTAIARAGARIDILPPNDLDDVTATQQQ
ncbi:DeoR/GlpR family DNA-binding transcription regulator [Rhodobacteraceae bacterium LMO-12]|nr:DeoR/GlpR family DNA-binding transcription regulator [Rhodobacteraceae bacterium LMO-JJ12]